MTDSTSPFRSPNGPLDRAASALVRRRATWAAVFAAAIAVLAAVAATLPVRLAEDDFLVRGGDARGGSFSARIRSTLFVVAEADSAVPGPAARRVLEELGARLRRVDGVEHVAFGPHPAEVALVEDFLPRRALLHLPPDSLRELGRLLDSEPTPDALRRVAAMAMGLSGRWTAGSRVRVSDGVYALPGDRVFFGEVRTAAGDGDLRRGRATLAEIRRVVDGFDPASPEGAGAGFRLSVVGYPVTLEAVYARLTADAIRVGTAATLVVTVLLALAFRRFAAPVVLMATVAAGMLATAAAAAVAAPSISLATLLFVPLVLGIGVDFGIYPCTYYWKFAPDASGRAQALASALRRAGPGLAVASLTSAAAALSVAWMPTRLMGEVSVLTAVGLVLVLVSAFTILPLLLSFSRPGDRRLATAAVDVAGSGRDTGRLAGVGWLAFGCLVAAGAWLGPGTRVELDQWRSLVAAEPSYASLRTLAENAGVAIPPLEVRSTAAGLEQALERDRRAAERLADLGLRADVAAVQSIARFLPPASSQRANLDLVSAHPERFAPDRLRAWADAARDVDVRTGPAFGDRLAAAIDGPATGLRPFGLDELRRVAPGLVDRHVSAGDGDVTVTTLVFLRRFPWEADVARRFSRATRQAGLHDLPGTVVPDPLAAAARREVRLREAALRAVATAAFVVTLVLWFRFRRARDVALCLLPLAAAVGSAVVTVRFLDIGFSLTSIAILPILVGLSVDDGVHVVDRLARGASPRIVRTEIGSAMLLTTLTTTGALACLALAGWDDVRVLGLVGGVGMWAAYATAVLLVPTAWRGSGPAGEAGD